MMGAEAMGDAPPAGTSDAGMSAGTSRLIKIFLATPNDLKEERAALEALVKDINDVLTYLAPEQRLSVELLRYETHAFPDVGQAQEVINRQIPLDYDVLIGAMWRRCGTPTKEYPSGTIEEFWRAYRHREKNGSPVIMFYFCEQLIPVPTSPELDQLKAVVAFREEVAKLGYTVSYPSHDEFREVVRPGLLRAIRSLLQADPSRPSPDSRIPLEPAEVDAAARQQIEALATEYDQLREKLPSGADRTRRMSNLFSRMLAAAAGVSAMLGELQNGRSAGHRLAAIAILHALPSADHLDWLAERLDPKLERPFVGYQAATGLLQAVRSLPASDCPPLRAALVRARTLAERNKTDPDRLHVLQSAERELAAKCGSAG
jgi:hypothetical protein